MPNPTGLIGWRKAFLLPLAIMGGAILVAILIFYYPQLKGLVIKTTPAPTPKIEVITAENGKLPPDLPKDIVFEKNVQVLLSTYTKPFTYAPAIYQIQSQFSFVSKKSLSENYSLYTRYFKDNKWQVADSTNESDLKRLTAIKDSDKISVTMSTNSLTKENTVAIQGVHIGTYASLNKSSPSPTPRPSPTPAPSK